MAVPLLLLQTVLQPPQCAGVLRLVSQPLAGLLSQSPKPEEQAIPQLPLVHVGVPPAVEHFRVQPLQLLTSVFRLTSQPSAGLLLQSAKPGLHAPMAQVPLLQVAAALANVHLVLQALQLLTSVFRLTSQPFVAMVSQLAKPAVHAPIVHVLLTQLAAALVNVHLVPQPPQLLTSFVVFVPQVAPGGQVASPAPQVLYPHTPLVHAGVPPVVGHLCAAPQPPQLLTSEFVLISQPLAALASQSAKPALQMIPQLPAVHVGVPPAVEHLVPQVLQLLTSVFRFTSQPSAARLSQLANPAVQVPRTQTPLLQPAAAFANVQMFEQLLQWLGSEVVLTSQPLLTRASQFAKPGLQLAAGIEQEPPEQTPTAFAGAQG